MKRIFLLEYIWSGHNVGYFHMLAQLFRNAGCEVIAIIPDEATVASINNSGDTGYKALLHKVEIKSKYLWQNWPSLTKVCREAEQKYGKPNLVFFPYLDNLLFPTAQRFPWVKQKWFEQLFPYKWGGLYFHPGYQPFPASEQMLGYRNCAGVGVLNPLDIERIKKDLPSAKLIPFPDFANLEVEEGQSSFIDDLKAKAKGRPIVASLGVQARRKGIITFLDMAQLPGAESFYFFAAGELRDGTLEKYEVNRVAALAASPPDNLWVYAQKIASEGLYNRILQEADIVFVGYQNFPSSSNTLTKAAYFNTPILASEAGYIGWATRTYNLGITFNAFDPAAGLAALNRLSDAEITNEGQDKFLQINSHKAAHQFIDQLLSSV